MTNWGILKGFKARFYIHEDRPAIFLKARPVPYAIRAQVEAELDKLVQQKIIEPFPISE